MYMFLVSGAFAGGLFAGESDVLPTFALKNGDVNGDLGRDLSDGVYLLSHLFTGTPAPVPLATCAGRAPDVLNGDTNGDGERDVSDPIHLLGWLYYGDVEPVAECATYLEALGGGGHRKDLPRIVPPNVRAFGTTYSDLAVVWWNWAINQPPDSNPITDPTGEFCHEGQDEDWGQGKKIFFLAGSFGGPDQTVRHCTIPKGKALFFPLFDTLWIVPEECGIDECRQFANDPVDQVTSLSCTIDGVPVADIFAYRAQSPPGGSPFEIRAGGLLESLAPDFYVPRGSLPGTVSDGYWIMVVLDKEADEHEIEFSSVLGDPENPTFQLSVKYFLTVAGH
jgi:hypothetical protein